jgi:hypothetical protein
MKEASVCLRVCLGVVVVVYPKPRIQILILKYPPPSPSLPIEYPEFGKHKAGRKAENKKTNKQTTRSYKNTNPRSKRAPEGATTTPSRFSFFSFHFASLPFHPRGSSQIRCVMLLSFTTPPLCVFFFSFVKSWGESKERGKKRTPAR